MAAEFDLDKPITQKGTNTTKEGIFAGPTGTTRSITFADGKQLFDGPAPGSGEK